MNSLSVISLCVLLSVVGGELLDSYTGGTSSSSTTRYFAFTFVQGQTTKGYQQISANLIRQSDQTAYAYGKAYLFSTPYNGNPQGLPQATSANGLIAVANANNLQTAWTFTGSFSLTQSSTYYIYLDTVNPTALRKISEKNPSRPTFSTQTPGVAYTSITNEFNFNILGSSCGNLAVEDGETCDGGQCCSATCSIKPDTQRCTDANDVCKYCSGTSGSCGSTFVTALNQPCGMCTANPTETAYCSSTDARCGISCTPGSINDPLIMGFYHQQFYFDGIVGRVFNMLSQPHLSINGLFKEANGAKSHHQDLKEYENTIVIGEAGIVTQNNRISFTVASGRKGVVNWNEQTIKLNSSINVADLDDCVQLTWAETSIMLTSPSFEIVFAFKSELPSEKIMTDYLNIKLVHIAGNENEMGGVIGQTALKNARISLKPSEFQVSNILATDSIKSTYSAAAIDCDQKREHPVRFSASFEHGLDEQRAYESYDA